MDTVEASGRSVDDAILQALARLGRRRDEVEVTVLQEPSRGNRGVGIRDAKVRVWLKQPPMTRPGQSPAPRSSGAVLTPDMAQQWLGMFEDDPIDPPLPPVAPKPQPRPQQVPPARTPPPAPPRRSASIYRPAPPAPPATTYDDGYEEFDDAPATLAPITQPMARVPSRMRPDVAPQTFDAQEVDLPTGEEIAPDAIVQTSAQVLSDILRQMGLDATVELLGRDPLTLNVRLDGDTEAQALLIGRRGETLASLQLLVNLIVNHKDKERYHIMVDVENYCRHRDDNLRSLANRIAQQVQQSQRPMTLEPMTPYERRIVHMTLQELPGIQTQSTGEGEQRRVVVSLKSRGRRS